MNGNEFLDKMELVDEKYIQEANETVKKPSRKILMRFCAMAACCALALALGYSAIQNSGFLVQPQTEDDPASPQSGSETIETPVPKPPKELLPYPDQLVLPTAELPQPQPFEWPELQFDGMGYEGYWMKEFSEFRTGNPWTPEMHFETLPVYRNAVLYSREQLAQNAEFDVMQDILLAVASRLGLDAETLEFGDNGATEDQKQEIRAKHKECGLPPPDEATFAPTSIYGKAEGISIEVSADLTVSIRFEEPRPYPQEVLSGASGLELEKKKAAWLAEEYDDLLGMEQPAAAILGGDYLLTMEQLYSMHVYDAAGSDLEKILHYNFYQTEFCDNENGNLFLIWLHFPDLTNLLGNYPTITLEQAQQELLAGRYVTSVPYDVFSAEDIVHAELVYRTGTYDPIYVPYYKFYVDVTDDPEHYTAESWKGMRDYGVYYVPAIDPEYLTSLPLWDGHIN